MARITGKNTYIKFGSTDLSVNFRSFDWEEEGKVAEATAGADTNASRLATYKDGKASMELVGITTGAAAWLAVAPHTEGTLEFAEEGTAVGKPKHSVLAIVVKRSKKNPFDDLQIWTIDLEFQGAVTDGTY